MNQTLRPHNGVYLDRSFRRQHQQAIPLRIPSAEPVSDRSSRSLLDGVVVVLLGLGLGASLLLAVAMVLGAGWLVIKLALELARLVGQT